MAERAGADLSPGATWALVRIDEHGFAGARALAEAQGVAARAHRRGARASCANAASSRGEDDAPATTPAGPEMTERVVAARKAEL